MAISYLIDAFGEDFRSLGVPLTALGDDRRCETIDRMVRGAVNAPLTSSLGRLFDGVAAMAGLGERVSFEGQAAMALEMVADMDGNEIYNFTWERGDGSPSVHRIPPALIIRGVVDDLTAGVPPSVVSGRFHRTLIQCFADLCGEIRRETGIDRVAMSGGAFQNAILLSGLISALEARGLTPITHRHVPANDGGIALGQAVVAGVRAQSEER
jgi:hydrogenase maturation protein HypF